VTQAKRALPRIVERETRELARKFVKSLKIWNVEPAYWNGPQAVSEFCSEWASDAAPALLDEVPALTGVGVTELAARLSRAAEAEIHDRFGVPPGRLGDDWICWNSRGRERSVTNLGQVSGGRSTEFDRRLQRLGIPTRCPQSARFVTNIHWSYSPAGSDCQSYWLSTTQNRKRWVLWTDVPTEFRDGGPTRAPIVWMARKSGDKEPVAAMYLLWRLLRSFFVNGAWCPMDVSGGLLAYDELWDMLRDIWPAQDADEWR